MGVNGIYGLSGSGIDVESMVKVGMMSKQNEYDKMYKKETKMSWQKEAYSTVYTDLMNFGMNKLTDYKLQSNMNAKAATSNNENSVAVAANGSAVAMSHTVEVSSVTINAYLMSTDSITRANTDKTAKDSIQLKDVMFKDITSGYTIKGSDQFYAKMTESEDENHNKVYAFSSADGTKTAYVRTQTDNGKVTYQTSTDGKNWTDYTETDEEGKTISPNPITESYSVTDAKGNTKPYAADEVALSFVIDNGTTDTSGMTEEQLASYKKSHTVSFTYAELAGGKTLNDLATAIKKQGLNITASYDSVNDSFSLYNLTGGKDNKISLTMNNDATATLFNNLKLGQSSSGTLGDAKVFGKDVTEEVAGTDGSIKVDGRTYDGITTGKITVAGVTYSLLNKTTDPVTVTVTQDTDAIIDRVKQFVEDYNAMLDELQDKYHETVYSDYGVLTKSQEDGMTKEQVEKWNEKAKSGLLNHDKYIGDIISKMREALATPVEGVTGKYNSAFSIGIDTTNDRGHIKLDDEKLKKVLAAEPNSVYEIFGKLDANDDYNSNGVAQRLGDVVNAGMSKIKEYAGTNTEAADGSTLGSKILEWQNKMSDFKTKMTAFENLLYEKYDAMEVALQRLGMTLNYVTFGQS